MSSTFFYEVYTKNPETGESGWNIETGWCEASSIEQARSKIQHIIANFDVFIQVYKANMNKEDTLSIW